MELKFFAPQVLNVPDGMSTFLDWIGLETANYVFSKNIDEVLSQDIKIACIAVPISVQKQDLDFDPTLFDLILVSDIEYVNLDKIISWLDRLKIKNYLLALGGLTINTNKLPDNVIYRPWWSFNILNHNQFQETNNTDKPFLFDVLLGARKGHRDFIMAKMQTSELLKKSIVNYRDVFPPTEMTLFDIETEISNILDGRPLLFPYVSENLNPAWEVAETVTNSVSYIVPWEIYKQTKYSVIAETEFNNSFFLTEKTTKAVFAKRLFVVFSVAGFLKNLKNLGFMTFDKIIDESYDSIEDPVKRFTAAFAQLEYLGTQDYSAIQEQIKYITEYNFQRLFSLQQEKKEQMKQMVYNKIKELEK